MFTQVELIDAINELEGAKHSIQNCEKLAAIYTVLDHLYPEKEQPDIGYSQENRVEDEVGLYGKSKFLEAIAGKPPKQAWLLMDELIDALSVLNPKLLSNFFDKLYDL